MISRRRFIQQAGAAALTLPFVPGLHATEITRPNREAWIMPDEAAPHERTWMAFGASAQIWGERLLPAVQKNLADIALTIAKYEPVSMLVRKEDIEIARALMGDNVDLIEGQLDDLWARDTAPLFVLNEQGDKAAVDFNFNGWGNKQQHRLDAAVAKQIARLSHTQRIQAGIVMEGGCIEVDGQGTAIIAESCTLNANRNPDISKVQFEDLLIPLLGLDKIIWIPGIRGRDITDGHTDFYARFTSPGNVVVGIDTYPESYEYELTREHWEILSAATDAQGNRLSLHALETPDTIREEFDSKEFAAGYVGFYVCNHAVIMQEFGDKAADAKAKATMERLFPERTVEALNVDGSIHCATQQEPQIN